MRLIDATPFSFEKVVIPDGGPNFMRGYGLGAKHVCDEIDAAPTIDAVPIKPLCAWLAAYAAPPNYALDEITEDIDPTRIVYTANDRARAWEYHWQHLMECGLMEEEPNGRDHGPVDQG